MNPSDFQLSRRQFVAAAAAAGSILALPRSSTAAAENSNASRIKIQPFDFQGVRLGDSRWGKQFQSARDFYLHVSNDDILCGYRRYAGLLAPGQPLGGWCAQNSNTVFGQWLSGMSRMYRATGDDAIRDKAIHLAREWAKTIGADGNSHTGHYPFEKLVCGLVDL